MSTGVHTAPKRARRSPLDTGAGRGRTIVFSYVPALDGLRAVAVLGVMLYHGGAPVAGGGFLGVDVFFVLSGFLITSLLLGEWTRSLTVKLGQFWARRARRLLPALLVMLVGVAIFVKVFSGPGQFAGLRLDSLSTLFYVANRHFIVAGGNYFAAAAQPSPSSTCGPSPSRSSSTSSGRRWCSSCSIWVGSSDRHGSCGRCWRWR